MSKDLGSYVDVDQDRQIVVPSYERFWVRWNYTYTKLKQLVSLLGAE
jgi:hypothetical protein